MTNRTRQIASAFAIPHLTAITQMCSLSHETISYCHSYKNLANWGSVLVIWYLVQSNLDEVLEQLGLLNMAWLNAEHSKKSKGCLNRRGTIVNTATEYSKASSIHGIVYIFDHSQGFVSRIAWLLIVMSAVILGGYWSFKVSLFRVFFQFQKLFLTLLQAYI